MVSRLSEVLAAREEDVVRIAAVKLELSQAASFELFQETKKFLWLQALLSEERAKGGEGLPRALFVFDALKPLDEMWHQFILCTRDYLRFCERHFGGYLHHQPLSLIELYGVKEGDLQAAVRHELKLQCRFIAQKLGSETLRHWYGDLAKRYPI